MIEQVSKKILLVDDELLIAQSEKMELESLGYRVEIISDGDKAVKCFQQSNDIDLVLMDIDLGAGNDGTIIAQAILENKDVPIIFLSSHSEPAVVEKTEGITSYGYILKGTSAPVMNASIKMAFKLFEAKRVNQQSEQALQKSERLLRYVIENRRDFAYKFNIRSGWYDYVSPGVKEINGFSAQEFLNLGPKEIARRFHSDDREQYVNHFNAFSLKYPKQDDIIEYRWLHKDGSYHWYSDSRNLLLDPQGKPESIVGNVRDITDKKEILDKLRKGEEEFRNIFNNIVDGLLVVNKNLEVLKINPAFTEMTGISNEEIVGKNGIFLAKKFVNFRDLPKVLRMMSDRFRGKNPELTEITYNQKILEIRVGKEQKNGEYIVTLRDITNKRRTELSLLETQENFNRIVESTPLLIYKTDKHGIITYASPSVEKVIGYTSEEVVGKNLAMDLYVNPEERTLLINRLNKFGSVQGFEARLKKRDGSVMWIASDAHIMLDEKGNYKGVEGLARNITKQKVSEEILREKENAYRTIFENTGTASVIIDDDRTILLANNEFSNLVKLPKNEIEGKRKWTEFTMHEDLEWMKEQHELRRVDEKKARQHYEFRLVNSLNEIRYIYLTVGIIPNTRQSIASLLDITELKNSEKNLQEKENYYRTIFENNATAMAIVSSDMRLLSVNNQLVDLTGYSKRELEGQFDWTHFIVPEDIEKMMIQHQLRRTNPDQALPQYEFRLKRKDKSVRDVFVTIEMIPGTQNSIASMIDISDRKKAENENRQLLIEKELILKEVHHRIKNNLAMVKSLLNIQINSLNANNVESALVDATERIDSIIVLYDKLFQSRDYQKVKAKSYFIELINDILKIFPIKENLDIDLFIDDIEMDTKLLSSLGIITNELLTNTIKYAFPDNKRGEVRLNLKLQDHKLVYFYHDNGVGYFPQENQGFGLTLIKILVEQLHGQVASITDKGVEFKIEIELGQ
ncbi:MAG: PAS domain S-box protein [Candidatus Marinimicrobia bacterium]|nr:PAS domain S-box protein [Candidatus Neomarinimicrobiota bacterium]